MADDKSCEGKLTLDIDCSNIIKGLKAIQREAKKATHALRELEEQQDDMINLPIRPEGSI